MGLNTIRSLTPTLDDPSSLESAPPSGLTISFFHPAAATRIRLPPAPSPATRTVPGFGSLRTNNSFPLGSDLTRLILNLEAGLASALTRLTKPPASTFGPVP